MSNKNFNRINKLEALLQPNEKNMDIVVHFIAPGHVGKEPSVINCDDRKIDRQPDETSEAFLERGKEVFQDARKNGVLTLFATS